jgi:hypothetical protein
MPSKSPLNIVEDALASLLDADPNLSAFTIYKGEGADKLELPSIIVACESASAPTGLAQVDGNYMCKLQVGVFNNVDDNTITTHREATQYVMGALDDLPGVKASFSTIGDASCYDCTFSSVDAQKGDRCYISTLSYDVLIVLAP